MLSRSHEPKLQGKLKGPVQCFSCGVVTCVHRTRRQGSWQDYILLLSGGLPTTFPFFLFQYFLVAQIMWLYIGCFILLATPLLFLLLLYLLVFPNSCWASMIIHISFCELSVQLGFVHNDRSRDMSIGRRGSTKSDFTLTLSSSSSMVHPTYRRPQLSWDFQVLNVSLQHGVAYT